MAAQIKEGMTGGQVADIIEQNFENLEDKFQQLSDQFDHTKEDINRTLDEYQSQVDDAYGSIAVQVDEEDTTTDKGKIKFKDRAYEPDKFSGKGYKILRKNIVCNTETGESKNILTEDMINEPNTVYEIRYDFDLNDETITIPEGCVLQFEGGSFNNGTIKGIENSLLKILGEGTICDVIVKNEGLLDVADTVITISSKINSSVPIINDKINVLNFIGNYEILTFDFGTAIDIADALQNAIDYSVNVNLSSTETNRYLISHPTIYLPAGRYILSHKVDIPSETIIDFGGATIIPYSENGDLSAFLDDDSGKYVCFRIGNYYYYKYAKISNPDYGIGSFGNFYTSNSFDYDIAGIKISDNTTIHNIYFNSFKGGLLYNTERNKHYIDSGYCDKRRIYRIGFSGANTDKDVYDVEIYWGDALEISHILEGNWLIKNTDGAYVKNTISASLYIENASVLIDNLYSTHSILRIKDSQVQINKGRFIQNNYVEQYNYNIIEISSTQSDNFNVSTLELNSCIFIGRLLSSYNIKGSSTYYDIYRDQYSIVTLNNTYHQSSDFATTVFETLLYYPYSNILFESKDSTRIYGNFRLNAQINDGLYRYTGSSGINGIKYIKVYALIDKDRFVGKKIDLTVDFSNSNGVCQFNCAYSPYIGNYLGIYIGDSEDYYNQYVIIPVYNTYLTRAFRIIYNGYTIDNTYELLNVENTPFPNVLDSNLAYINDKTITVYSNSLPTTGTWSQGDTIYNGLETHEYDNNKWKLRFGITTDYKSLDTNYIGAGSIIYDSTLHRVLMVIGIDRGELIIRDTGGSLPCPKYVEDISELEGKNFQNVPVVFDRTKLKPFWGFGDGAWFDANGYRSTFPRSGSSEERPSLITDNYINFQYFDTTLNKPIWWTGSQWVDATGADV